MTLLPTSLEIRDFGCIGSMILPPGWCAPPSIAPSMGDIDEMIFYAPQSPTTKISLVRRCKALPQKEATAARECLGAPPHSLTPEERLALGPFLRGAHSPEKFKAVTIATGFWNKRIVLIVNGLEIASNREVFWLLVDSDGSGAFLQDIIFGAVSHEYERNLSTVMTSLASIEWL